MKTQCKLALCLLTIAIATGCATVPATALRFNPKTGEVTLDSPKDVSLTNLTATVEQGKVSVTIGALSSKNNVDVITAVTQANLEMTRIMGQLLLQGIGKAAAGAAGGGL